MSNKSSKEIGKKRVSAMPSVTVVSRDSEYNGQPRVHVRQHTRRVRQTARMSTGAKRPRMEHVPETRGFKVEYGGYPYAVALTKSISLNIEFFCSTQKIYKN